MESTFKKKYQTVTTPEGNLEIKWTGSRIKGPGTAILCIFSTVLLPIPIGIIVFGMLGTGHEFFGALLAIGLGYAYIKYVLWIFRKKFLIVVTKQGLIFEEKRQLAFKDIQSIGVAEVFTHGGGAIAQNYHVECKALGQSISLTRPTSDSAIHYGIYKEITDRMGI